MLDKGRKRSFSRRQFLRMSAMFATGIAAAACAPGNSTQEAVEEQPGGAAPAETPVDAGDAGEGAAPVPEPTPTVEIGEYGEAATPTTLWHGLGGADGATLQLMLQDYAEKNTDYGIRAETYGWDTLYQKLPTAVAAGTPPDMTIFHETEIEQFTRQGLLMPLDNVMYTGLVPPDDFKPEVLAAVTVDGKRMCVPFDNHGWLLYVNNQVIQDAGLDPENLPKNGTEFIDWAQKVTTDEAGKHPNEDGFDKDRVKVYALHFSWIRFTTPSTWRQYGQGIISDDRKQSLIGTEAGIAAVQYWYDLMYKYFVVPPAIPGQPSAYDMYATNSLALMWDGSWSLNFFKDNPDAEKVTTARGLNSLSPDGTEATKIGIHTMSIPEGVAEDGVNRASHLMKWLSDNGEFWATSGQVPARLSVQGSTTVQEIWSTKAAAESFSANGIPDVTHPAFTEIQQTWEAAVSAALANTQPVADAMTQGHQQVQAILDRP